MDSAPDHLDFPIVLPHPFERDFDVAVAFEARKLLSPLYQENAVFRDQVIQPEGFQLSWSIHSI